MTVYGSGWHHYRLDDLPGCTQVAVSHGMFIDPEFRKRGLSYGAGAHRINKMSELGYDYALCTVDAKNEAELKQLAVNGWRQLDSFLSKKTGHTVFIFGRKV